MTLHQMLMLHQMMMHPYQNTRATHGRQTTHNLWKFKKFEGPVIDCRAVQPTVDIIEMI